jgi:dTDP-4-amino-4,6-dideoxygalactose transaminase
VAARRDARLKIPFNRPVIAGREFEHIGKAIALGQLAGDGVFTERCQRWLEAEVGCGATLLTHSCTAALELAAILLDLEPGDEVIMPSYTFPSTANAVVLRRAVPVHSSPAGLKFARTPSPMPNTDVTSATLVRLPLFPKIGEAKWRVIDRLKFHLDAIL